MDITWESLVSYEPRLVSLRSRALSIRDPGPEAAKAFCANQHFYGRGKLKWDLATLVGFCRQKPLSDVTAEKMLRSSAAYDLAYSAIYDPLPNCRNCMCL